MKFVRNLIISHRNFVLLSFFGCCGLYIMYKSQIYVQKNIDILRLPQSRYGNVKYPVSSEFRELAIRTEVKENCRDLDFLGKWANNLACRYFEHTQIYTPYLSETLEMNHFEEIRFIKTANGLCAGQEVDLLFVVHTAPSNFLHRNAVRNTWGAGLQNLHKTVKVAFIVGESMVEKVNEKLMKETAEHSDMIVVEMLDHYHKLSLKNILLFRWARDFCPQAHFIVKCDDDIVVNPLAYTSIKEQIMTPNNSRSVIGNVKGAHLPGRDSEKWGIPSYYYPFNLNPPFPMGLAVIIGKEASLELLELSKVVAYDGIEDFFVFGILSSLGNITLVSTGSIVNGGRPEKQLEENPTFVWLTNGPEQMEQQWNEFIAPLMNVAVPVIKIPRCQSSTSHQVNSHCPS